MATASQKIADAPNKLQAPVWNHFGFKVSNEDGIEIVDKHKVICKICKLEMVYKTGTTSNLKRHIEGQHPQINLENRKKKRKTTASAEQPPPKKAKGTTQPTLLDVVKTYSKQSKRHNELTRAVALFMCKDMGPFSIVNDDGFRSLLKLLDPKFDLPGRTHFAETVIPALYTETKTSVLNELKSAPAVAITTDGWTSRSTESYVTITAHIIDEYFQAQSYVLQTRKLSVSHTAENLAAVLNTALIEWHLVKDGKKPFISTDNAANIVNAVKICGMTHIRCLAHTLNLATQKAMKVEEVINLLKKVRHLVGFFHRSSTAAALLTSTQKGLNMPQHKLIQDVATRWNSSYDMLSRYTEQRPAISATLLMKDLKYKDKDLQLSDNDVAIVDEVITLLAPFKKATTALCSEKYPTVSLIFNVQKRLLQHVTPNQKDSSIVASMKQAMHDDLYSRYNDPTIRQFLLESSALDPRFKSLPYSSDVERNDVFKSIGKQCKDTFTKMKQEVKIEKVEVGRGEPDDDPVLPQLAILPDDSSESDENNNKSPVRVLQDSEPSTSTASFDDLFGDIFITKVEESPVSDKVDIELADYRAEPAIKMCENPLHWWQEKKDKYTYLSKLAVKYLVAQATSVASERVFSTAGDIVNAQRACLGSDTVDKLIFLKKNLK